MIPERVREILAAHPEVKFVSLMGIDIGGHDTDEKIPVEEFIDDMEKFLENGVQTDGSSVVLPNIAKLNNAKVDIIPDSTVNWFVDHNFNYQDYRTGLPVGNALSQSEDTVVARAQRFVQRRLEGDTQRRDQQLQRGSDGPDEGEPLCL